MNPNNLYKSYQHNPSPEEEYYSNRFNDQEDNGMSGQHYKQINPYNRLLKNSYSNPRMLQHNNNLRCNPNNNNNNNYSVQFNPPRRPQPLGYNNSCNNILSPMNQYINNVNNSMGPRRGGPIKINIQDQNSIKVKLYEIENKMNQIEKQSQRIEAFNDIFFKMFPQSQSAYKDNNRANGLPRIVNKNKSMDMNSDTMFNQQPLNLSMSQKISRGHGNKGGNGNSNGNGDFNAIDEEFMLLKDEIGNRLARIRQKQKLQTDAIQYILKHSGNPNFNYNYMQVNS